MLTHNYIPELVLHLHLCKESVKIFQLPDFETEMDFCSEVKYGALILIFLFINSFMIYREMFELEMTGNKLMIVQCDYGERNTDLIACARHRLIDEMRRPKIPECGVTHVLFIVQLPRVAGGTAFTSFQGGPWTSIHIDELTCPSGANQVVKYALSEPLHKFFNMLVEKDQEIPSDFKINIRIRDNIQLAVSRIVTAQSYKKMEKVIEILLVLISDEALVNFGE